MIEERLQKIISQWGIASRRQAEQMILTGRVRVNGEMALLGQKADPKLDRIEVDGKTVNVVDRPQPIYLLLHKPVGVICSCAKTGKGPNVLDLLPQELQTGQGIHPVGRLDVESTGALLLTNDGKLTFCLTHPSGSVSKTYQVWVEGHPPLSVLQNWRTGVILSGQKTLPAEVQILDQQDSRTLLQIILKEGRNRQIRRVAQLLGYPVIKLHRTAIGPIQLQPPGKRELPVGAYRSLKDSEINYLYNRTNLISITTSVDAGQSL